MHPAERDRWLQPGLSSEDRERIKAPEPENPELRQVMFHRVSREILMKGLHAH
jgi:hypothetical protein